MAAASPSTPRDISIRMAEQNSPAPAEPEGQKSFEESFAKLEETVRALETGRLSLDQASRLFEDGMSLARRCNELLSAAELKVTRLQTAFAEQMRFLSDENGGEGGEDPARE